MAKVKLGNVKGSKGDKGDRGSLWRVTDKMTGQSTSDTAFPGAGFEDSAVGDMCLNPITCDIYKCTAGGDAANAKWVWVMNNRGPQGPAGPKGDPTTVDAVLSESSANPIQNKAVAVKFKDVQDSLSHAMRNGLSVTSPYTPVTPGDSYTCQKSGWYVLGLISNSTTIAQFLLDGAAILCVSNGEIDVCLPFRAGTKLATRKGEGYTYTVRSIYAFD